MKKILVLTMLGLFFLCGTCHAAAYYVNAVTGSDTNGGTSPSDAWKTITHATGTVSTGDQILVAAGTYDASNGESFPISLSTRVFLISTAPLGATIDAGTSSANVIEMGDDSKIEGFVIKTSGPGSGIYVDNAISGVTIIQNVINASKTGIEFKKNNSTCIISYNVISGADQSPSYGIKASWFINGYIGFNEVRNFDTGLEIQPSTGGCNIVNNTIVKNNIGIRIGPKGNVNITNCIIASDPDGGTTSGTGILVNPEPLGAVNITYCDVYGNQVNYDGAVAGEGCISENAQFVDAAGDDYGLTLGSPCIDAGYPEGTDIGCYPFVSTWVGQPPMVRVISPDGGEIWGIGVQYDITWTATQPAEPVQYIDISYSIDGGTTYTYIITGEANDGLYSWTVTDTPTTQAKVRVEAVSSVGIIGTDESDAVFTIWGTEEVIPGPSLSGITLPAYTNVPTVPVDALGVTGSPTHMMISENSDFSGASWVTYADPTTFGLSSGDGTKIVYYKLKDGSDNESNTVSDSTILDQTSPTVVIQSPNGGESWEPGTVQEIRWNAADGGSGVQDAVDIYYSSDGGQTYSNVIVIGAPNTGSFNWTVPNLDENDVRIRVVVKDNAGNQAADESDANLEIKTKAEDAGPPRIISGIITHPRPYSPSKDGTFKIIYSLNKSTDVTIYIYGAREIVWKTEISAGANGGRAGYNDPDIDLRGMNLGNGIYVVQIYAKSSKLRKLGTGHLVVFE